jgi:hypothetical protein
LISELDGVALSVGLLELDGFGVQENTVELDIDVDSGELGVVGGSAQLNQVFLTTSMSLLAFLVGCAARVSFSMVQSPVPQGLKGQGMDWRESVCRMVKAESEQTSARNNTIDLFMISTLIILLMGYH